MKTFGDVVDEDVKFVQIIFNDEQIINIDLRLKSASILKKIFRDVEITDDIWYPGPRLMKLYVYMFEGVE